MAGFWIGVGSAVISGGILALLGFAGRGVVKLIRDDPRVLTGVARLMVPPAVAAMFAVMAIVGGWLMCRLLVWGAHRAVEAMAASGDGSWAGIRHLLAGAGGWRWQWVAAGAAIVMIHPMVEMAMEKRGSPAARRVLPVLVAVLAALVAAAVVGAHVGVGWLLRQAVPGQAVTGADGSVTTTGGWDLPWALCWTALVSAVVIGSYLAFRSAEISVGDDGA